jgi:hypothetical protein
MRTSSALDTADGVATQGKERQRNSGCFSRERRRPRQEGMRHGLAGGIEHPQVAQIGTHYAFVHRRRQFDLKQAPAGR